MDDQPNDEDRAGMAMAAIIFAACFVLLGMVSRSILPFIAAEILLGLGLLVLTVK